MYRLLGSTDLLGRQNDLISGSSIILLMQVCLVLVRQQASECGALPRRRHQVTACA